MGYIRTQRGCQKWRVMGRKETSHRHALIPVTMTCTIHLHIDNTCRNNVFASQVSVGGHKIGVEALLRVGVWGLVESFVVPLIREEI